MKWEEKYYELLSIDSVDTLRSRMVFKRESSDDSYSMHLEYGLIEMKRRMRELIEDGVTFRNCIVTGHGSSGHIKVCSELDHPPGVVRPILSPGL